MEENHERSLLPNLLAIPDASPLPGTAQPQSISVTAKG